MVEALFSGWLMSDKIDFSGITETTACEYLKIGEMLVKKFNASDNEKTIAAYVDWIAEEYINKCAANTWRKYRRAAIYHIYIKHPKAVELFQQILLDKKPEKRVRAQRRKSRKSYREQDFSKLLQYLQQKATGKRCSYWWHQAAVTLQANSIVGLRPVEWITASSKVIGNEIVLRVFNAKNTHGRSHGHTRTLHIPIVNENDADVISEKIRMTGDAILNRRAKSFKAYHKTISSYLLRANNAVFGKDKPTIAVYSARHQFSANLKAAGCSKNEVAAAMGHASNKTAGRHYGKKSKGRRVANLPQASKEDIASVSALNRSSPSSSFSLGF